MTLRTFTTTTQIFPLLLFLLLSSGGLSLLQCSPPHKHNHNNPRCSSPLSPYTASSSIFLIGLGCRSIPMSIISSRRFESPINDPELDEAGETDETGSDGIFTRINSLLDTPILDANNKGDQGPITEALKDFVRDDPQLAQITFSGVLVLLFFVSFRLFNAVRYGGF